MGSNVREVESIAIREAVFGTHYKRVEASPCEFSLENLEFTGSGKRAFLSCSGTCSIPV